VTPLIVTSRLELRPFRPEDAAELHEIFSDPETHTIGEGPFTSPAQTAVWISRRAETEQQRGLLWYAVRDRAGGRMLGNCGLFAGRTGSDEPEIGYEIRRSCQGLATEAARAVLDDALASGVSRVWATIRPHNTASLRVAAKIGMTLRHTRPDSRGPLAYLARP
jgi:[ribosomal protein S5]-alanine N-acetyltransferase